jgi:hypothetical protein
VDTENYNKSAVIEMENPNGIEQLGSMNNDNIKVFCTCEGAVVAVNTKPEHEKREYSVTETEVLGSDFGESIRRSDFEVKWDSFDDPESPRSMTTARKWLIICTLASVSLCS